MLKKAVFCIFIISLMYQCQDKAFNREQLTVTLLPQKFFVQKIAGKDYQVNVMLGPGADPHSYEPTPQQMKLLSGSKIYFQISHFPFESVLIRETAAFNPGLVIVDTSKGIELLSGHHEHEGETHNGHETGIDPHIWLSPRAVKVQLKNILLAMIKLAPEKKAVFEKNYHDFLAEINQLDAFIISQIKQMRSRKFIVFHPAWAYFCRDYGLQEFAIEVEGKEPNPADMKKIIDLAKKEKIKIIFIQKQLSTVSAETIAKDINGRVAAIDPLDENWLENIYKFVKLLKSE